MERSRSGLLEPRAGDAVEEASIRSPVGEPGSHKSGNRTDTAAHVVLLILAIGVAWFPTESRSWTAVVLAAAVLMLCSWGWRRSSGAATSQLGVVAVVMVAIALSSAAGWDPSSAVGEIGLAAAAVALFWLASRSRPPENYPSLLAVGLTGLAILGIWQVVSGLETIRPDIEALAAPARAYAEERIASRRAFASLPLPGHLAVLLATALPLFLDRVRATLKGFFWVGSAVVAAVGLAVTRSPIGLGLAVVASVAVLVTRNRQLLRLVVGGLMVMMIAVVAVRPDVAALDPVSLRVDNWRTGVWLWTTSPASGVGVASFAQASQANPLDVGNRPAHAHSLPVEALAEFGPVGLIGILFLGGCLFHLVRRLWKSSRGLAVAIVVVPLHNLLDFSFFVSGVALPWAVLLGWAAAQLRSDGPSKEVSSPMGRLILVAVAASALGVTILHSTSIVIEESAAVSSDPKERFSGALQALRMAPWRVEPQFLLATSAIASADQLLLDRAWGELDGRRWVRPRSAAMAERRARLALARGDVSSALAELWSAAEYGTPGSTGETAFGELVQSIRTEGNDAVD